MLALAGSHSLWIRDKVLLGSRMPFKLAFFFKYFCDASLNPEAYCNKRI